MTQSIWLTGLMFANLWATGNLDRPRNSDNGVIGAMPVRQQPATMVAGGAIAAMIGERRVPIVGPIHSGVSALCDVPPGNAEILRALPSNRESIPYIFEEYRDEIEITKEKLVNRIDPPRFYPLVGLAQLHHCHWKCTVYFTETVEVMYPYPVKTQRRRAEVVYFDKCNLHLCVSADETLAAFSGPGSLNDQTERIRSHGVRPAIDARPAPVASAPIRVKAPDILFIDTFKLTPMQPNAMPNVQNIRGEHLIRPDGTIHLGMYGSVNVNDMTLGQIKGVIEHHLATYFVEPKVVVDVKAYNSRKVYVIADDLNNGSQRVTAVTLGPDGLSVLDAIEQALKLRTAPYKTWVARPNKNESIVLPVDWKGITEKGETRTNYLLQAGDRLYVVGGLQTPRVGHTEESSAPMLLPMPKASVKAQVQIEVIIAAMEARYIASLPLSSRKRGDIHWETLKTNGEIMHVLQAMRKAGIAKIMAEPRVMMLSGQPGYVLSGGEKPVLTTTEDGLRHVSYKEFGTKIQVLPTVGSDGRIRLEAHVELSDPDLKKWADAKVATSLHSGETVVILGNSLRLNAKEHCVVLLTARTVAPVPCETTTANSMTLADVARLGKRGISDDIIIRQMELTGATFSLTVDDILMLSEQGVSDAVIRTIQTRLAK